VLLRVARKAIRRRKLVGLQGEGRDREDERLIATEERRNATEEIGAIAGHLVFPASYV
jgi:hypothetical protein